MSIAPQINSYTTLLDALKGLPRIIIIGAGGSGKSTLAKKISDDLKLELFHLDHIYWQKEWTMASYDHINKEMDLILSKDRFIIEGTYEQDIIKRLEACDVILSLNTNVIKCLFRVIKRSILHYGKARKDGPPECIEKISLEYLKFLMWIMKFKKNRLAIEGIAESHNKKIIRYST